MFRGLGRKERAWSFVHEGGILIEVGEMFEKCDEAWHGKL